VKTHKVVNDLKEQLEKAGIEDPSFEAELLTRHAGNLTRVEFYAGADLVTEELERLHRFASRRLRNEPSAYILGTREFYGMQFQVSPAVLIPRPETELLVQLVSKEILDDDTIIDVGTGSGCIAISLFDQTSQSKIIGTDISTLAIQQARENAVDHKTEISFIRAHLASSIKAADIIVANLPYIPTNEVDKLPKEIKNWEPVHALNGGRTGIELLSELISDCGKRLKPRLIALEVGFGQAKKVARLLKRQNASTEIHHDLAGIERVVLGRWS
tara:strand:+ start:3643 stop:4458 length:816 start_codon:yes stop_codon:yes gene_type:complete